MKSERQPQRTYESGEADAFCSVIWGLQFQLPRKRIAALTPSIRGAWTGSALKENSKAGVLDRGCLSWWDEAAASPGAIKQEGLDTTSELGSFQAADNVKLGAQRRTFAL